MLSVKGHSISEFHMFLPFITAWHSIILRTYISLDEHLLYWQWLAHRGSATENNLECELLYKDAGVCKLHSWSFEPKNLQIFIILINMATLHPHQSHMSKPVFLYSHQTIMLPHFIFTKSQLKKYIRQIYDLNSCTFAWIISLFFFFFFFFCMFPPQYCYYTPAPQCLRRGNLSQ